MNNDKLQGNQVWNTIITLFKVIITRYDAIFDQSERVHLINHWSINTKEKLFVT